MDGVRQALDLAFAFLRLGPANAEVDAVGPRTNRGAFEQQAQVVRQQRVDQALRCTAASLDGLDGPATGPSTRGGATPAATCWASMEEALRTIVDGA